MYIWLQDKSFTFILKTPPASVLLLKAAGIPLSPPQLMCILTNAHFKVFGFAKLNRLCFAFTPPCQL